LCSILLQDFIGNIMMLKKINSRMLAENFVVVVTIAAILYLGAFFGFLGWRRVRQMQIRPSLRRGPLHRKSIRFAGCVYCE
jgi:hypothetical protein